MADIWAAGVLLYAMVYGKMPFVGKSEKELANKISKCSFSFPLAKGEPSDVSAEAQDLIRSMLTLDVDLRITA
jgi:serine/threonine protein kinase